MDIQGTYQLLPDENVRFDLGRVAENDVIDIRVTTRSRSGLSVILHIFGEQIDDRKRGIQPQMGTNVSIRVSGVNGSVVCCVTNLDKEAAIEFRIEGTV